MGMHLANGRENGEYEVHEQIPHPIRIINYTKEMENSTEVMERRL